MLYLHSKSDHVPNTGHFLHFDGLLAECIQTIDVRARFIG